MKATAVFALRVLALTFLLIVIFMVAVKVAGVAQPPAVQATSTPASQAQQAAAVFPPLLAYAFLISVVTSSIIQNSRWRGLKLIAALIFTVYGLMTFISQIETIAYLRAKMPPGLIEYLFIMGAVVVVMFVPLAVLVMGKMRGQELPATHNPLFTNSKAVRFAVLAIVYIVLYYLFGYFVAWQNPDVRIYYAGSAELKSFFQVMHFNVTGTPWMLPLQFLRGLLWALFAYPVIRMLNTTRLQTMGIVSALFAIWSFVLLMPNPLMSASVAHSHFWETLWCDLILGAAVGWVLYPKEAAQSLATPAIASSH